MKTDKERVTSKKQIMKKVCREKSNHSSELKLLMFQFYHTAPKWNLILYLFSCSCVVKFIFTSYGFYFAVIGQVAAINPSNFFISYSIANGNGQFAINAQSGQITASQAVPAGTYTFTGTYVGDILCHYHGYTWSWAGKVCRAGHFSGGVCVWCVKIFFPHFLSGYSIDTGQTKTASTRLISLHLFAHFTCSTADEFGHIIFTHQTQTPPEKPFRSCKTFPVLQNLPGPAKPSRPMIKCIRRTAWTIWHFAWIRKWFFSLVQSMPKLHWGSSPPKSRWTWRPVAPAAATLTLSLARPSTPWSPQGAAVLAQWSGRSLLAVHPSAIPCRARASSPSVLSPVWSLPMEISFPAHTRSTPWLSPRTAALPRPPKYAWWISNYNWFNLIKNFYKKIIVKNHRNRESKNLIGLDWNVKHLNQRINC